ncbi:MAG: molecular chaperone DnaJ [Cyanobacteria bacterium M5B4]|nr:MAG: molecular chaperone DnaJ [Cyanobacteria bacterium M5B4]
MHMIDDHYEVLQVHPKADQEAIQAAYTRMLAKYDAERLSGGADELVQLASMKRAAIEQAYAVLGDPQRRANYDAERAAQAMQAQLTAEVQGDVGADERIDYRPLPPAKGQERPRSFNAQPTLPPAAVQPAPRQAGRSANEAKQQRPLWLTSSIVVGVLTFVVMLSSLFLTEGAGLQSLFGGSPKTGGNAAASVPQAPAAQQPQAPAPTMTMDEIVVEYEAQVVTAQQMVNSLPDNALAWRRLGDALYDSVQVIREKAPDSALYQERIPRWREASEAYDEALQRDLGNTSILSERGVTRCYYGAGIGDPQYVQQGLADTQEAAAIASDNGRIRLNYGMCLISSDPPQTEAALAEWQAVLAMPAAEIGVARQAQILIEQYQE